MGLSVVIIPALLVVKVSGKYSIVSDIIATNQEHDIIEAWQTKPWYLGAEEFYEPVWSGERCSEQDKVDVGRGSGWLSLLLYSEHPVSANVSILGSCNTDCDCPPCSPFCSTSGYCQNNQNYGRRKIALDECWKQHFGSSSGNSDYFTNPAYAYVYVPSKRCRTGCTWSSFRDDCVDVTRARFSKCK